MLDVRLKRKEKSSLSLFGGHTLLQSYAQFSKSSLDTKEDVLNLCFPSKFCNSHIWGKKINTLFVFNLCDLFLFGEEHKFKWGRP